MEADDGLITQLTKVTFLARMGVIAVGVVIAPTDTRLEVVLAVLLTASAGWGLFATESAARLMTRHPSVIVADTLVAGVVASAAGADSLLALYALSTAVLIGLYLPRWFAALLVIVLVATFILAALISSPVPRVASIEWTTPAALVVVAMLAATARQLYDDTLDGWRANTLLQTRSSRQTERLRLARDMHDSVVKSLHGIRIAADTLPRWVREDSETAITRSAEISAAAAHATQEARSLLEGLRDDELDFVTIVDRHVSELRPTAAVHVDGADDPRWNELAPAVLLQVDFILGELTENVRRHSNARNVWIDFRADPVWTVRVRDDGDGFDPAAVGSDRFGLTGARERLALLDGRLRIDSSPGEGTTAEARFEREHPGVAAETTPDSIRGRI